MERRLFSTFLPIFLIMASMISCSKDKDEPSYVQASESTITIDSTGGSKTISVSSNTSWLASSSDSWVTLSQTSGDKSASITISIAANTSLNERNATITIKTSDGDGISLIQINQAGLEETLSVDITDIVFGSESGASQSINIRANCDWTLSNLPEWLQSSSLSGNGASSITLKTRSANETSSIRTGTFSISSTTKSVDVSVSQEPSLSSCKVKPINITALYYGVAFDLWYSSEVATCKILMVSDYNYKHLTERELISEIEKEDSQIPEDNTIFTRNCEEGEKYHLVALAYDSKGNRGELTEEIFTAPKYLNGTDDAWCSFSDATYSDTSFGFTVNKQGRCASYNLIYGTNIYTGYLNRLLMAFEMNYYINNHKKHWFAESWDLIIETNYPNDHRFSCSLTFDSYFGGIFAAVWGIFADGTLSSDLNMISGDIFAEDALAIGNKKNNEVEYYKNLKGWKIFSPRSK